MTMKLNLELKALEPGEDPHQLAKELLVLNPAVGGQTDHVREQAQHQLLRIALLAAKDKPDPSQFLLELLKSSPKDWLAQLDGVPLEELQAALGFMTENFANDLATNLYVRMKPALI
jgi:hypothetical protein